MVEQNAYCADVLVQAAAARAALDAFSRGLLSDHIRCCVVRDLKAEREGAVDELLALLQKLMT